MVFFDKPSESKVLSLRMPSTCTVMRSPSAGRVSSSAPDLTLLFFLAGFASLSLSSPSLASPAPSSSSSESFAAAAAAAAAAFFANFRSLTLMPEPSSSASSRSRFLTADFIFFFRARSALSSSADMPEEPMVTASRGSCARRRMCEPARRKEPTSTNSSETGSRPAPVHEKPPPPKTGFGRRPDELESKRASPTTSSRADRRGRRHSTRAIPRRASPRGARRVSRASRFAAGAFRPPTISREVRFACFEIEAPPGGLGFPRASAPMPRPRHDTRRRTSLAMMTLFTVFLTPLV